MRSEEGLMRKIVEEREQQRRREEEEPAEGKTAIFYLWTFFGLKCNFSELGLSHDKA